MRSLLARNETARFTTISGFKSYIFLINQSFWTGSLCFSNRKYTKIADSSKKSADIHYHVNKNTVLLIWCVALGQYIVYTEWEFNTDSKTPFVFLLSIRPREVRSEFSVRPFSESDAENFQYSIFNIFNNFNILTNICDILQSFST